MDRTRFQHRRIGWLMALAVLMACGCQTVRTPEEKIAKSNLPREFTKVSMPDYVVEPPDLILRRGPRGPARAGRSPANAWSGPTARSRSASTARSTSPA